MNSILHLDPALYQRHAIHAQDRQWAETNCYVDIWVELLHAWGFDPVAALPFALAIDFEGDQWTFIKFPLSDLYELYGLDVQELAIWKPLITHIQEQLTLGHPVLVEVDSFYLPDTSGMAYLTEHVKSTIAVNAIDFEGHRLGYFHGQGYYQLTGDDFVHLFHLHGPVDPTQLPPYVEFVKRRDLGTTTGNDLTCASLRLLRRQLNMLPLTNPFVRFRDRMASELSWLAGESLDTFHKYSFATLRQFGAAYELASTYLSWLGERTGKRLEAAAGFEALSIGAKTIQFHLARAVARKKPLDLAPLDGMSARWQAAMDELKATSF
jgi:Domain of unknown function (DUF1839)